MKTQTLRLDSGISLPGESTLHLAVDVHVPAQLAQPAIAFVCLPGGGMSRRYYDLATGDDATSFSFVRQMTARGFVVATLDYLGIGESDRPQDGYALTPELLARANAHVTATVIERLRRGDGAPGLAPQPQLQTIGLGHSMGAMMTIVQQAAFGQHQAIALLGFSTRGLPEYLSPEARAMDAAARRADVVRLARAAFKDPYPMIQRTPGSSELYASARADPRAAEAIKPALQPLLPVPSFTSMLPGNVAVEAARLEVPVLLGLGEFDMAGPPHQAPCAFTGSRDVTLQIYPGTGHSHFVFPVRMEVFSRIATWARSVIIG